MAGRQRTMCSDDSQDNAALYDSNEKIFAYGFSMINNKNLVLDGKGKGNVSVVASRAANGGGRVDGIFKSASVAVYFRENG